MLLLAELGGGARHTVALAAGVHGDEPAGAFALLTLAEEDLLDSRYAYRIWCCINPTGFERGTRENLEGADINRSFARGGQTPEARAIVTSNRDRTFALSIDFHEDRDASGFYCYAYGGGGLGGHVVAAVAAAGFPLQTLPPVQSVPGCLTPDAKLEAASMSGLSYNLALARRAAKRALTLETPSALPQGDRIAMHRIAALEAIGTLRLE
ncbi:MAG: succinylglutamate desuccinylase/aspartoacylase family protein [Candidatus Eremiobacteraeota bacterium]|nr:succinylglutamate desuccinylase/aspartoacylase family protein [Candidatus Eremiobacteraeota bacterium]